MAARVRAKLDFVSTKVNHDVEDEEAFKVKDSLDRLAFASQARRRGPGRGRGPGPGRGPPFFSSYFFSSSVLMTLDAADSLLFIKSIHCR